MIEAAEIPDDEAIDAALAAIAEGRPMSRIQSSLLRSMLSSVWSMTREGRAPATSRSPTRRWPR